MKVGDWIRVSARPPFIKNKTVAATFAVWGAFLSSVALGVGLFRYMTRRGKLRLLCFVDEGNKGRHRLLWNVTNVGHETVVVARMGATFRDGGETTIEARTPLPLALRPREFVVGSAPRTGLLDRAAALWAEDGRGRRVVLSGKSLRRLREKHPGV